MPETIRINKFLAHSMGLSRREADSAVQAGRVTINGQKAILGAAVSSSDHIAFDGRPISAQSDYTYLTFNKPVGYLCSRRSQGGVPTIFEILPQKYRSLKPVGRLDKNSSGLILLTDDGDFAHRMTHPSFHKTKTYQVRLDQPLQPLHQQMISDYGVTLEDGVSRFMVEKADEASSSSHATDSISRDSASTKRVASGGAAPASDKISDFSEEGADQTTGPASSDLRAEHAVGGASDDGSGRYRDNTNYIVTMSEGRNRQIRRTFAALGYTVTKLHRTTFGPYSLNGMKKGEHRLADKL